MLDTSAPGLDMYRAEEEGAVHAELRLASEYQAIYSLAHRRAVGYEGLIRAKDPSGLNVPPADLFRTAPQGESLIRLDRQCRSLHVRNFLKLGDARSWLFLNVDPYVATEARRYGSFFSLMLQTAGFPAHRVAVELIESPLADEQRLVEAVAYYRDLGCLIVIDDFGAGYSNFDRIWRLKPDIVKIDREMTRRVTVEPLARRMFSGIVAVLHEAGALVCVEGIETEAEALCATDADADLMQGYYFARPAAELPPEHACEDRFARLAGGFRTEIEQRRGHRDARTKPYLDALRKAVRSFSEGTGLAQATRRLLELDCTQRCYLIAADGNQIGTNIEAERNTFARDRRLEPIRPTAGTNWQTKPYFRRAIESPGEVQVTRPYLSVTGPRLCVTFSMAFAVRGSLQVLCMDLDFLDLARGDLSFAAGSTV